MKKIFFPFINAVAVLLMGATALNAAAIESGPGNGTDYVKILFADAQVTLFAYVDPLTVSDVAKMNLTDPVKTWLMGQAADKTNGPTNWDGIKHYLHAMSLQFQQAPCSDATEIPASICFFNNDAKLGPYVMISVTQNGLTTKEEAMAMLIHEAGHFVGQMDHLFMDQVGVQLVSSFETSSLLVSNAQTTDTVANIFAAKDDCNKGTSDQADELKKQVLADLTSQCVRRNLQCNYKNVQYVFTGTTDFTPGVGFDMNVTCAVKAQLDTRAPVQQ